MLTLDERNAFNSAPWDHILRAAWARNVPGSLLKIMEAYLCTRSIELPGVDGEEGRRKKTNCGVPQGSVLGPDLCNLLYDDLVRIALPDDVELIAFADDVALILTVSFSFLLEERLEAAYSIQTEMILNKKKKWPNGNQKTLHRLGLCSISPECYRYLRDKLEFPLPGLSTLRQWAGKFNMDKGILKDVLMLLKNIGKSLSEMDKVAVISFDETYVSKKLCCDKKTEQVLGPFKCVQVMMARGLFSKWKQPLYYDYDSPMTQLLLFDIISQLYICGFNVAAVVNDMGSTNIRLRKNLGITPTKTSFTHPISGKQIYMFADVPHLMKLVRNHFIDSGFILPNKKYIRKQVIQEIVSLNKGDLSCVHKVIDRHLNAIGSRRQNVKLATQVLSNSMAKAISYLGQKKILQFTNWRELMFEDLKERYPDIKCILTRRINQDLLENLFSALKIDCLSAVTINEAEVNNNNNMDECRQMYFNEEISTIESNFGSTETFGIPEENINLLNQFESYVNPVNELTELEKDCIEYVIGYVASRYATEYPWLCNKEV
ncbi:hypothetical protein QTP88_006198 [Uroleucon formosanum]